ncbi:hypothetical protein BN1708_000672 [Verticillium longisporum]|uniref:Uncharacterized protein n=1 Tax=Verticillium longisporum TaxID=100787 RepID=A0A0G4LXX7_VERLO|nr:hypothetical protein BN1708_000672 [Verticillium longisporum]
MIEQERPPGAKNSTRLSAAKCRSKCKGKSSRSTSALCLLLFIIDLTFAAIIGGRMRNMTAMFYFLHRVA